MSDLKKFNLSSNDNNQMQLLDELLLQLINKVDELLVFKGGYMLSKVLPASRMTHDIDLSILNQEEYENMKPKLKSIGEYFIQKGLADSYEIMDIIPQKKSGGIKLLSDNHKVVIGLDISVQNLSYGITKEDINIAVVDSYCIERMLSDKLYVILSNKRYRRTKDLYDLYNITQYMNIDYKLLKECIYQRGYDEYLFDNIPFSEEDVVKYVHSWNKLSIQDAKTGDVKKIPDLEEVLNRLYIFSAPFKFNYDRKYWSNKSFSWI